MKSLHRLTSTALLCLATAGTAQAAAVFTSEALFQAASAGTTLSLENFENPVSVGATSVTLAAGTVSCTASEYCPGFFGVRNFAGGTAGAQTVYFATPSDMVFTFNSAITAFGIDIIGLGTVGATDMIIDYQNGSQQIFTNFSSGGVLFAGVVDAIGFTSVTFRATQPNDGIDFDRMQYGAARTNIPEPASLALVGAALLGLALSRRRST